LDSFFSSSFGGCSNVRYSKTEQTQSFYSRIDPPDATDKQCSAGYGGRGDAGSLSSSILTTFAHESLLLFYYGSIFVLSSLPPFFDREVLPCLNGWPPATGALTGAYIGISPGAFTGTSAGVLTGPTIPPAGSVSIGTVPQWSVPQPLLPYPSPGTSITVGDASFRQAVQYVHQLQYVPQYAKGYGPGGQQAAPVLMAAPLALSAAAPPTAQPGSVINPAQGLMPAPFFAPPQPAPLPGPSQQPLTQPYYVQPSQTQQTLAQPAYIQSAYAQPAYIQQSWPVNAPPLSSPSGSMSAPLFWPGSRPVTYLPSTPYLPSTSYLPPTPYGNTFGSVFFASTPYPLSPPSLGYPFFITAGPIM